MIRSGLNVPAPAIPIPDLAVPYAAPAPIDGEFSYPLRLAITYTQISSKDRSAKRRGYKGTSYDQPQELCRPRSSVSIHPNYHKLGGTYHAKEWRKLGSDFTFHHDGRVALASQRCYYLADVEPEGDADR